MHVSQCRPLARYSWTPAVPLTVPQAACPAVQGRRFSPLSRLLSKGCLLHLLRWGDSRSRCGANDGCPLRQDIGKTVSHTEGQTSSQHVLLNLSATGVSACRRCWWQLLGEVCKVLKVTHKMQMVSSQS